MAYAPDITDPIQKPADNGNNNNNHRGGGNRLPAFQPGQLRALANQLSGSFGGGLGAWKKDFRNTYDPTSTKPFNFGGHHRGGNNNGGGKDNGGGDNTGTGTKPGDGGFDTSRPDHNRMMPMQMNAQQSMRQMQMPQMGLMAGQMQPMQQQQPQQQSLLGDIPPEVLAFIRSRGV